MKFKLALFISAVTLGMAACNYETVDKFVSSQPNLPESSFVYEFDAECSGFCQRVILKQN